MEEGRTTSLTESIPRDDDAGVRSSPSAQHQDTGIEPGSVPANVPAPAQPAQQHQPKWWETSGQDPWEGLGGIPRTAKFFASDKEWTVLVFRRFHEASLRSLLNLEARVAALTALQATLDYQDRDRVTTDSDVFEEKEDELLTVQRSWEDFAVIGSKYGKGVRASLPRSVIKTWNKIRTSRRNEPSDAIAVSAIISPKEEDKKPAKVAEPPASKPAKSAESTAARDELDIRLRWEVAVTLEQSLKDYRKPASTYLDLPLSVANLGIDKTKQFFATARYWSSKGLQSVPGVS